MSKHRLKKLEEKSTFSKKVESPVFLFKEGDSIVINRDLVERLGYSTKDFISPVVGGGLYKAGDPLLCLMSLEHPLFINKGDYYELKGATGSSIVL